MESLTNNNMMANYLLDQKKKEKARKKKNISKKDLNESAFTGTTFNVKFYILHSDLIVSW